MAKVQVKWGKMKFKVSSSVVKPINDDLAIKYSYDTDDKKKDDIEMSFSYDIVAELGVDVKKEITKWKSKVGKKHPIYVGKQRLGPKYMMLTDASASSIRVDAWGRVRSASISLSFTESNGKKSSSSSSSKSSSKKKKSTKKTSSKKKKKSKK